MTHQRGDVVLVPVPFTNLQHRKVRPAVVLSGPDYHATEPDLILGAITTNLTAAAALVDYPLADWKAANLRFPSAFKPILFTLERSLIVHQVGRLSARDLSEISLRVRLALALETDPLRELLALSDLAHYPADQVQALAEKATQAVVQLSANRHSDAHPERLRVLLVTSCAD